MNDKQREILDIVNRAKQHELQSESPDFDLVNGIDRVARSVESESALWSPSCDFSNSSEGAKPVHYLALFVDKDCLDQAMEHLDRPGLEGKKPIEATHLTLAYKPDQKDVPRELFGTKFVLVADGYGYDGENEALRVHLEPDTGADDFDQEAFDRIQKILDDRGITNHITLSVSKDGKAVNSKNLDFKPIEPFRVGCVLGGHLKNGQQQEPFSLVDKKNIILYDGYRALNKKSDEYVVMATSDPDFADKVPIHTTLSLDHTLMYMKSDYEAVYGESLHQAASRYEEREIFFEHEDCMLFRREDYLFSTDGKDGDAWAVEYNSENLRKSYDKILEIASKKNRVKLLNARKQELVDLVESKGLHLSDETIKALDIMD